MRFLAFLSFVLTILCSFIAANSQIYQWTDENGNLQFSNTQPPASNKNVITSRETTEDPTAKAYRLEEKAVADEEKQQYLEMQRLQQVERRQQAEIRKQEERAFRRSRPDLFPPQEKINAEVDRLYRKNKKDKDRCGVDTGQGFKKRRDCQEKAYANYQESRRYLEKDPAGYFARRENRRSIAKGRRSFDETENSKPRSIINAQTGEVLNRAAGGYTGSRDGTFYSDAAGGIINTRTGDFSPTN